MMQASGPGWRGASMRDVAAMQLTRMSVPPADPFSLLIEAVVDYAIYMLDPEGRVLTWNPGAERLKGYRAEEVIGSHFSRFFPVADTERGEPMALLVEAAAHGRAVRQGFRIRKDGTAFWADVILSAIRASDGQLIGFAKVTHDRTDSKRHQDQLRASEERFRTAMTHSAVPMAIVSLDGRWSEVNAALCDYLGYSADELTGMTFQQVTASTDLEGDLEQVGLLLSGRRENYRLQKRYIRKDGRPVWGLLAVSLIRDADGAPRHFISQIVDIDQLKVAQSVLEEERSRLGVTLRSISEAVISSDAGGRLDFLNPAAERLTGWSLAEATGRPIEDVLTFVTGRGEPLISSLRRCLDDGAATRIDDGATIISRDGYAREIVDSASPIRGTDGELLGGVLVVQDLSATRNMAREVKRAQDHDTLTGLINRRKFEALLDEAVELSHRSAAVHTLCFFDLDRFKIVNDVAGHRAGDLLLQVVTQELQAVLRSRDVIARIGGDEFATLLYDCTTDEAQTVVQRSLAALEALEFTSEGRLFKISASAGLAAIDRSVVSSVDAMRHADIACYAAKCEGRNRVSVYDLHDEDVVVEHQHMLVASDIYEALREDRFTLVTQRIAPTSGPVGEHHEVLLRMLAPDGEIVPPFSFIPAAERYGAMPAVDRWVLNEVLGRLGSKLAAVDGLELSINLSATSLDDAGFLNFIHALLDRTPIAAQALVFEITESGMMNNLRKAKTVIDSLRARGCRVSLDDFGIGFSSFSYLRTFTVDYVKIDGSFVKTMMESEVDASIVRAINDVGHSVGARTVAEFVDSSVMAARLEEIGVDFVQGFGIAKPTGISELIGRGA
jgi:diguanylate cyclase (GGDEF)-like protein/PAS domain S-box-containing protein